MKKQIALISLLGIGASSQAFFTFTGTPYGQDFDSLPSSGSVTWTNDVTLPSWFSAKSALGSATNGVRDTGSNWTVNTPIAADSGTTGASGGGFFSYGATSASERALGGVNTNTTGDFVHALILINGTGATITSFSLSYVGEQWRDNGNSTAQKLVFDYKVSTPFTAANAIPEIRADNVTGYTAVPALDFTGPKASGSAVTLDGNLAANQVALSASNIPVTWTANSYLILRWWDDNATSNDHGLAIDGLNFSTPVPEPASLAILGLGAAAMVRRERRKAA